MRRSLALTAAVLVAVSWTGFALAKPNPPPNQPRPPVGTNPRPVVAAPAKPRPKSSPPRQAAPSHHPARQGNDAHNQQLSRRRTLPPSLGNRLVRGLAYGNGLYDFGYGYPYGYAYGYPYGYQTYYYYYSPYLLPVYSPMGPGFGGQGMAQGMGLNRGAADRAAAAPPPPQPAVDEPEPRREATRSTNAHASATAWKYIGYGDALFAKQRYAEAGDRYRRAASTAPQLAEAWFRRALALTATGRYDLAVSSVNRGLKLDPKWPKVVFDASDILWPDAKAKEAYFATLAKLAAENPANQDVLFLVGLHFHIDGQQDQAKKYLTRAQRIAGNDADHIEAFIAAAP
jgi:tetratricopeptide (TPR) repeat protein